MGHKSFLPPRGVRFKYLSARYRPGGGGGGKIGYRLINYLSDFIEIYRRGRTGLFANLLPFCWAAAAQLQSRPLRRPQGVFLPGANLASVKLIICG